MKKLIFPLILFLVSCSFSSLEKVQTNTTFNPQQSTQTPEQSVNKEEVISDIPKATWVEIFFKGNDSIDERVTEAGIKSLRKTNVAKNDIEIRIWMGFGLTKLEGFIMTRINNNWSAKYITADYISKKFINRNIKLNEPKSGWEKTWQKLLDYGILTLPDAESIKCNPYATDGFSYVVEIKKGDNYRTYMYENPDIDFPERCKESTKVLEIDKTILQEFDINKLKDVN